MEFWKSISDAKISLAGFEANGTSAVIISLAIAFVIVVSGRKILKRVLSAKPSD